MVFIYLDALWMDLQNKLNNVSINTTVTFVCVCDKIY